MSSLGLIDFPTRPSSFLYTPPPIPLLQLTSPLSNCFSSQPPVRLTLYFVHFLVRILSVPAHFPLRAGILLRTSSCPPVTRATQLDHSSLPFGGFPPPPVASHTSVPRAYHRANSLGLKIYLCPSSIDALGSSLILERQASF